MLLQVIDTVGAPLESISEEETRSEPPTPLALAEAQEAQEAQEASIEEVESPASAEEWQAEPDGGFTLREE